MRVPQKCLGEGDSTAQADVKDAEPTATTVEPIGWRSARPRSEKDRVKRRPMNAVEDRAGRQNLYRQANSAQPGGRGRRGASRSSRS